MNFSRFNWCEPAGTMFLKPKVVEWMHSLISLIDRYICMCISTVKAVGICTLVHSICSTCIYFVQLICKVNVLSFIIHVIWGSVWVVSQVFPVISAPLGPVCNVWHVFPVISAPRGPVCNVRPPMTWRRLRTHFLMLFTGSPWPSYYKTLNVLNAME